MKVLIAEDNPPLRRLLERIVRKSGYEAVLAEDGHQAMEILDDRSLRLALLDWMMPGVDGLEICRKLKEVKRWVYVILLTARQGAENIAAALEAGASDYITKPFKTQELVARIRVGERITSLQVQLAHVQKLESLGQLAAGIAHEINTPTQFIGDNTRFLQEAFTDLDRLVDATRKLAAAARAGEDLRRGLEAVEKLAADIDVDFIREEVPKAISQSLEGIERVAKIVAAMREFSHPRSGERIPTDLNQAIENTITVSRNEWRFVADMVKDLDPGLPPVPCFPGELNQVILNIIVNAAHAIGEMVKGKDEKGTIRISTRRDGGWVEIRIGDTGGGIAEKHRDRIFDPFFTTKEVGKGTGQGLALSRAIIADKHRGTIEFETEDGRGTTFIVRLPVGVEGP